MVKAFVFMDTHVGFHMLSCPVIMLSLITTREIRTGVAYAQPHPDVDIS